MSRLQTTDAARPTVEAVGGYFTADEAVHSRRTSRPGAGSGRDAAAGVTFYDCRSPRAGLYRPRLTEAAGRRIVAAIEEQQERRRRRLRAVVGLVYAALILAGVAGLVALGAMCVWASYGGAA